MTSYPFFSDPFPVVGSRFRSALAVSLLGGGRSRTEAWNERVFDRCPYLWPSAPNSRGGALQIWAELRRRPLDKGCSFGVGRQRLGSTALIYDGWDRRKGHALINMRVFDWGGHQLCLWLLTVDLADEMDIPDIRKLSLRKLGCINHSEWSAAYPPHPLQIGEWMWCIRGVDGCFDALD